MPTAILPIHGPTFPAIESLPSVKPGGGGAATSFSDLLNTGISSMESAGQHAEQAAQGFLSGANEDLHTVALAEQRAEIASELFLQIRNKAISAYQEIMKMQL